MYPGLDDAVGVAGHGVGGEPPGHPAEVLAVHPVVVERPPHGADELHAPITQPAVHVLDATGHLPDRSAGWVTDGAGESPHPGTIMSVSAR